MIDLRGDKYKVVLVSTDHVICVLAKEKKKNENTKEVDIDT